MEDVSFPHASLGPALTCIHTAVEGPHLDVVNDTHCLESFSMSHSLLRHCKQGYPDSLFHSHNNGILGLVA